VGHRFTRRPWLAAAGIGSYGASPQSHQTEKRMASHGQGMLIVWMNIAQGHEDDFDGWFTRQHVPERVAVPGFRNGARYEALKGEPHFLSCYETDTP
jgi:hypothetical protein